MFERIKEYWRAMVAPPITTLDTIRLIQGGYQPKGSGKPRPPVTGSGVIPPLTEGHVVKGGQNKYPSQIKRRPKAPGAITPKRKSSTRKKKR